MSATGDRRAEGFTLVEALVALAIAALLSSIGFPRLQSAIAAQEFRSATSATLLALTRARAEAIRAGRPVRFDADPAALRLPASVRLQSDSIQFFPDSTSTGGRVLLSGGGRSARFILSAETGLARGVRS